MARKSNDGGIIIIIILAIFGFIWSLFKVFGAIFDGLEKKKKVQQENLKLEEKKNTMFPNRIVDKSLSLFERNKDIINDHLKNVSTSSSRYKYYYIENITRDCINDISLAEGKSNLSPNNKYLSDWKNGAPAEWLELSSQIERLFSDKKKQLEIDKTNERVRKEQDEINRLLNNYKELIEQFNEIAYRKVTTIDDYGEEDSDALQKEIDILTTKIAKKEGYSEETLKNWKKNSWSVPTEYSEFKKHLFSSFKTYYDFRKKEPIEDKDLSKMSGIEFENYLAELLKLNGFSNISGTPKTGDQGADLIAKKDNKTIIIQAKRYEGSVGNKAVQEVIGAIRFYNGDEGWVITNSTFTKSARELASKNGIKLIDGSDLQRFDKIV